MLSRIKLLQISKKVCKHFGTRPVRIYSLLNRHDPAGCYYGFYFRNVIYMRFTSWAGLPYTDRFVLSIYAHELAHKLSTVYHRKEFKLTHRRITRVVKKIYEETV